MILFALAVAGCILAACSFAVWLARLAAWAVAELVVERLERIDVDDPPGERPLADVVRLSDHRSGHDPTRPA